MKLQKHVPFKTCLFLIVFAFLFSCECSRSAKGQIIDESTQLPIDSVMVEGLTMSMYEVYSDSLGNYVISTKTTGAVGGCPDYKVSYSKAGYETKVLENPGESNIYLKPN
jgi:hypothetical protein